MIIYAAKTYIKRKEGPKYTTSFAVDQASTSIQKLTITVLVNFLIASNDHDFMDLSPRKNS